VYSCFPFILAETVWTSTKQRYTITTYITNNWHCRARYYALIGPLSKQLYASERARQNNSKFVCHPYAYTETTLVSCYQHYPPYFTPVYTLRSTVSYPLKPFNRPIKLSISHTYNHRSESVFKHILTTLSLITNLEIIQGISSHLYITFNPVVNLKRLLSMKTSRYISQIILSIRNSLFISWARQRLRSSTKIWRNLYIFIAHWNRARKNNNDIFIHW